MVEQWASFVKTGTPLAGWPEVGGRGGGAVEAEVDEEAKEPFWEFQSQGDRKGEGWQSAQCETLAPLHFVWNPPTLSGGPY